MILYPKFPIDFAIVFLGYQLAEVRRCEVKAGFLLVVFCCSFSLLGGCTPKGDVFGDVATTTGGSSARQFECLSKNADGTCNVNQCTAGPGGFTHDCASYAAACVNAGEHWSGTKEGGKCTRVL